MVRISPVASASRRGNKYKIKTVYGSVGFTEVKGVVKRMTSKVRNQESEREKDQGLTLHFVVHLEKTRHVYQTQT